MLIYKHFAVFLKTIHTEEVHYRNLCKAENVRQTRSAQISYSSLFSVRIGAYRHGLSLEITRMLQECHLYVIGMVVLSMVAWIICIVDG